MDNEWIEHDGRDLPVAGELDVEIELRDAPNMTTRADAVDWKIENDTGDVLRYRVVKS